MVDKSMFSRLKRLFSTQNVIRNVGGTQLKVVDIDKIQSLGIVQTNSLVDRFTKLYSTTGTGMYNLNNILNYQTLRIQLYTDYEAMDTDGIICSVLDILADECSLKDEGGEILHIRSADENIQKILYNLFYDILNIEFNLWSWTRQMCKYGDFYLKLEIAEEFGIFNVIPYSSYNIVREEGVDPQNPQYVRFRYDPNGLAGGTSGNSQVLVNPHVPIGQTINFENYEMVHLRLIADANYLPYGRCLHGASKINTEKGIKDIKNIQKEDKVWTYNIEEQKYELADVINILNSGNKEIFKIETKHNYLECSPNHPILTYNIFNNKLEYKIAENIKEKDLICHSNNNLEFIKKEFTENPKINKTLDIGKNSNRRKWRDNIVNIPDRFTPEFARMFGFLLGDGWIREHTVFFAQGIYNDRNQFYQNTLLKFSGKNQLRFSTKENSKKEKSTCILGSQMLSQILKNNGFKGDCYTKRLPEWIYECNYETRLAFIKGFVDADGHIFTDKWGVNRYEIMLCNKELIQDLKILVDSLNIKSGKIGKRKEAGKITILGKEYNRSESWSFYFYLDGNKKQQSNKLKYFVNNINLFEVKSITKELPEETYDIQVSKNSNFIANGIIVHNSYIEPARKTWKQMVLMEDAMLVHRIMRAPERRIFYINVGNIPPNEVEAYIQKIIQTQKKIPYQDPQTGQYNLKFNMMNMMEDFYVPIRGNDQTTKIDTLKGLEYNGIEDVNYLINKLFAALKVPKAFMGYEKDLTGKATLAAEDIRFARTVERIQRILVSELTKIALIHLYTQGYEGESLTNFELSLTTPSIIYDQERVALLKEKVDLAGQMMENNLFPTDYIYDKIFHFSQDQFDEVRDLIIEDKKRLFRYGQIENEGNDPAESGQSYGTPHDLASLYGKSKAGPESQNIPQGYDENSDAKPEKLGQPHDKENRRIGRPVTNVSNINSQENPFGKDRLGSKEMGGAGSKDQESGNMQTAWKGGSPLALETKSTYFKNKHVLKDLTKKLIFERKKTKDLLDESNLLSDDAVS